jgi:hypothetical protein
MNRSLVLVFALVSVACDEPQPPPPRSPAPARSPGVDFIPTFTSGVHFSNFTDFPTRVRVLETGPTSTALCEVASPTTEIERGLAPAAVRGGGREYSLERAADGTGLTGWLQVQPRSTVSCLCARACRVEVDGAGVFEAASKSTVVLNRSGAATVELWEALATFWVMATPESDMEDGSGSAPQQFCGDAAVREAAARRDAAGDIAPSTCSPPELGVRSCRTVDGVMLFRDGDPDGRPWAVIYTGRALTEAAAARERARIADFVREARTKPCSVGGSGPVAPAR